MTYTIQIQANGLYRIIDTRTGLVVRQIKSAARASDIVKQMEADRAELDRRYAMSTDEFLAWLSGAE